MFRATQIPNPRAAPCVFNRISNGLSNVVSLPSQRGNTALHLVVRPGFCPCPPEACARALLQCGGADPNARAGGGARGATPLHEAAACGAAACCAALVAAGAEVDALAFEAR